MLQVKIPGRELFDESTNSFITLKEQSLQLEHSLVSLSKWESKWRKPFLNSELTAEEQLDYIRCMTITQNVDPDTYKYLPAATLNEIREYIESPMTATWFSDKNGHKAAPKRFGRQAVTSELIYYWMIALNIPFECQKWHLNRLLTLVEVCNRKNQPKKKMNKKDAAARRRSLNAARKASLGSEG